MYSFNPLREQILKKLLPGSADSLPVLVMPYFVVEGQGINKPILSMPGVSQLSIDVLVKEVAQARSLNIPAVLLFGIPVLKDELGSGAYAEKGIVQKAVRALKANVPGIMIITDVCLCEYTEHGHCGLLKDEISPFSGTARLQDFINLKKTLECLSQTALSHAQAGADIVAPSAMMPGQVRAIRSLLDKNNYSHIPVMGYSAKFASAFYGPFRDAAESAPKFGDRRAYQLDPMDSKVALEKVAADIAEGADIVMVKPALAYMDIIRQVRAQFPVPLAAYNVSAEYSMVKAAAAQGWIDEQRIVGEIVGGMVRSGAEIIITYHACDIARWTKDKRT